RKNLVFRDCGPGRVLWFILLASSGSPGCASDLTSPEQKRGALGETHFRWRGKPGKIAQRSEQGTFASPRTPRQGRNPDRARLTDDPSLTPTRTVRARPAFWPGDESP